MDDININISDVAALLNLKIIKKTQRETLCVCPICGDKRGKFSFNTNKNKYNCFHCDSKGGPVTLYMNVMDIQTPKKAANELYKALQSNNIVYNNFYKVEEKNEDVPKKDDSYIAKVYKSYLTKLVLKKEHKEDLMKRGLTEKQIKYFCYKSVPKSSYSICNDLQKEGFDLSGVPGFIKKKNGYFVHNHSGYYCPVFNKNREIIGMQIRVDNPVNGAKYIWFSSPNCSSGGLTTYLEGTTNVAIITEGINKAIITYALLNGKITVIGVPGIKVLNSLKPLLKKYTGYIYEAFDMDKAVETENEKELLKSKRIENAASELRTLVENMGIAVSPLKWDFNEKLHWNGNYKGIDDFLLVYGRKNIEERFIPFLINKADKQLKIINYLKGSGNS